MDAAALHGIRWSNKRVIRSGMVYIARRTKVRKRTYNQQRDLSAVKKGKFINN